jgi:lipopolysaccharide cholinephosphotransferase
MNKENHIEKEFQSKFRELLIKTFKFTIDFCYEHNLTYYTAYGTTLGTIRHGGLIPWDDDIDIFMPRNDYNKLLELSQEFQNTNYEIVDFRLNSDYYLPFAKICDKSTTILEYETLPMTLGVYVDIFPLDFAEEDLESIEEIKKQYFDITYKLLRASRIYTYRYIFSQVLNFHPLRFFEALVDTLYYKRRRNVYRKKTLEKENSFTQNISAKRWLVAYGDFDVRRIAYESEWFKEVSKMPFERLEVVVPSHYDKYLTFQYGDYMTFPPIEEQVSRHPHFYINLSERLSRKEVMDRAKRGEKYVL